MAGMTKNTRLLVAVSLAATALLSMFSNVTAPDFSGGRDDLLASIADGGTLVTLSATAFVLAQLPFVVGMVGLARWLQPSRLATVGGVLAVLGGFGHAVFGGVMLSQVVMAADEPNRAVYAGLLDDLEGAPVLIPFMALGLLGTVLGILLLSIAWWRAHSEPRWVAPLLWAFLLVEFVGSNLSEWASYLSVLLYAVALGSIAVRLSGRPLPQPVSASPAPDHEAELR
jgi:hypothetical protein